MLNWRAEDLWSATRELVDGLSIELLASTGSTNADALARLRAGDTRPCLIVAEGQTAGRGRLGRLWWSAPGDSLTFSLSMPLAPRDWGGLSLAVGLALAEALDPVDDRVAGAGQPGCNGRIGLKWPNDLWLRDGERKLAGILIETAAAPAGVAVVSPWPQGGGSATDEARGRRHVVIGVGLNIAARRPDAAPLAAGEVPLFGSGYAGLQELDARLDAPAALARVLPAMLRILRQFEADGWAPLLARYAQRDLLRGREVSAGDRRGQVLGVDVDGGLLLASDASGVQRVISGEVSVRPC